MLLINALSYKYQSQSFSFSCKLELGSINALVGKSGAGKSTLLALLAGILTPSQGEVSLLGEDFTFSPPHLRPLSILFQEHNLFTHLRAFDNIALGISPALKLTPLDKIKITETATRLGINDLLSRFPHELSGGQKQRVALARCLTRQRPLLLLDEPFSALDTPLRKSLLAELKRHAKAQKITVLMVTHQEEEARAIADYLIQIENGQIKHQNKIISS